MTLRSDDSLAMVLLCSHLGLPSEGGVKPLTLREWNRLAEALRRPRDDVGEGGSAGSGTRPGDLLAFSAADLESGFDLSGSEAERIARLLDRGAAVAIELERLDSLGMWIRTRAEDTYPRRLKARLGKSAPPILFGSGATSLFDEPALAVVGSRDAIPEAITLATEVGEACAQSGLSVVSGGARGIDLAAMAGGITAGGTAVGVLADGLERKIRPAEQRSLLEQGRLLLTTPYSPSAGFSVGAAMGRNKLIYALADFALVVTSDANKGGTWAGAVEALGKGWVKIFAVVGEEWSEAARLLVGQGAFAFPSQLPCSPPSLYDWLNEEASAAEKPEGLVQRKMFS